MRWRILVMGDGSSAENMAIDESILIEVLKGESDPTIRFYGWDPATVSCGYNQSTAKEIDLDLVKDAGFGFVRRPTGGRVVLHNKEVTYAVIAPVDGRLGGSVVQAYAEISLALAAGLGNLGIEVEFEKGELSSAHQRLAANPCFSSTSRFELSYRRRKLVGSAQVRKEGVLLQHGSILLNNDQSQLAYLLPGLSESERVRLADYLKRKTVAINQVLSEPVSFSAAAAAFEKGFRQSWREDEFYSAGEIGEKEKERVRELSKSKYLTEGWNKRK
ncbi:MAG: lipoate--protein ligase family protein [Candidatus Cloacimonetes bacterium]|nr:lipoate--protein ligase family protein [Candidatus Cloacimonadota bacterium]